MLRIKLSQPVFINRKYVVFIDREVKQSFSNKRQALDYITRVEKELNEALLFINEEYSTLSGFYRNYFLADRDYKFKYDVENNFSLINNRLTHISSHTESENFNSIISQALNLCFEALSEACDLIDAKSHSRYDMLTSRRISLRKKIIGQYKDSFEAFKAQSVYSNHLKSKTA